MLGSERALWDRRSEPSARRDLAHQYLPLAKSIARRYTKGFDQYDDLVQVACVGLLKAIDRYDIAYGFEFSSYAVPMIEGELKRHFRDCCWPVHVPRSAQKELAALRLIDSLDDERPGHEPGAIDPGYEQVEDRMLLAPVVRAQPLRSRWVLWMRAVDDFTQTETAEVVGCSRTWISTLERQMYPNLRRRLEA